MFCEMRKNGFWAWITGSSGSKCVKFPPEQPLKKTYNLRTRKEVNYVYDSEDD